MSAGISDEEFQRLQSQILDLRSANYQYEEECKKLRNEITSLQSAGRAVEETQSLSKSVLLSLSGGGSRARQQSLEQDAEAIRRKLALQEEEFSLQNQTLSEELNRVFLENGVLEQKVARLEQEVRERGLSVNSNSGNADYDAEITKLKVENQNLLERLSAASTAHSNDESQSAQHASNIQSELTAARAKISGLEEAIKQANAKVLKAEQRSRELELEKTKGFADYKKSLEEVTARKDADINDLLDQIAELKRSVHQLTEFEEERQSWAAERAALNCETASMKSDFGLLREQNETFQIQLQETHSANDVLSAQLEGAKADVVNMQKEMELANQAAENRRRLLEESGAYADSLKSAHKTQLEETREELEGRISQLEASLTAEKDRVKGYSKLEGDVTDLSDSLNSLESEKRSLQATIDELTESLTETQLDCQQQLVGVKQECKAQLEAAQQHQAEFQQKYEEEVGALNKDREICMESIARLKQEVKDKDEQERLLERKHRALLKELKKQAQVEKRRADKLQERLTEVLSNAPDALRMRSPGPDESFLQTRLKPNENGDNSSVSSWSMVSGGREKDGSRRSPQVSELTSREEGEEGSECSTTILEQENEELLNRLASLQKSKWELEEKTSLLEEGNAALSQDLMQKTAIIEQYVKEKPVLSPSTSGNLVKEKLPGGLRNVMEDVMRLTDPALSDIRAMNRRLQIMLEETLTKNMHLQRDVEMLSHEVARLSAGDAPVEKLKRLQ